MKQADPEASGRDQTEREVVPQAIAEKRQIDERKAATKK